MSALSARAGDIKVTKIAPRWRVSTRREKHDPRALDDARRAAPRPHDLFELPANGAMHSQRTEGIPANPSRPTDLNEMIQSFLRVPLTYFRRVVLAASSRAARRRGDVLASALTAHGRPEDDALALATGFDRHLTKPVEPEVLTETVAALAASARARAS